MKKKSMLAALGLLSLLQGSVYAREPEIIDDTYLAFGNKVTVDEKYDAVIGNGWNEEIKENTGEINGADITVVDGADIGYIYSAETNDGSSVKNTTLLMQGGNVDSIFGVTVYGGPKEDSVVELNSIKVENGSVEAVLGGTIFYADYKNNTIEIGKDDDNNDGNYDFNIDQLVGGNIYYANAESNKIHIKKEVLANTICGIQLLYDGANNAQHNKIYLDNGSVANIIMGVTTTDCNNINIKDNKIEIRGKVLYSVIGVYNEDSNAAISNNDILLGNGADVSNAALIGYIADNGNFIVDKSNDLIIDEGWTGKASSINNFNNINFENLEWNADNKSAVLTVDGGNIEGANVNIALKNGQQVNAGEFKTLISSDSDLGKIANDGETNKFTIGTTTDVEYVIEQSADNQTISAKIDDVKLNDQTMLVAENRAVAAAFVNQGTDLIADSLDTLSRDGKYGVKTFAAVHGNRSKYDVNSDIKINGWSTIVGVGSETEHNGGDFSWGVFYENGSGNYRTFNSFNNEYFRGDGSLVYNGGGIAARYENAHGVYTEGSLRAGMLKSDMDNALSDGENKYGYSSESEYYGAHIGIGQIIPLSESSDLDVYGKVFHTYTEGDSFKVDTDKFEFDSINSDRLRVGARLTTNKENKFSTYYGLAYEYEFNGDAEMRAAGMSAPTQSLQGSSYMAEVGFNYQPTPESPWSFDLNMRGYAGEREGATFNVQATYTF